MFLLWQKRKNHLFLVPFRPAAPGFLVGNRLSDESGVSPLAIANVAVSNVREACLRLFFDDRGSCHNFLGFRFDRCGIGDARGGGSGGALARRRGSGRGGGSGLALARHGGGGGGEWCGECENKLERERKSECFKNGEAREYL